jgi:uncharacterized protein YgbK (DUF1537 family)
MTQTMSNDALEMTEQQFAGQPRPRVMPAARALIGKRVAADGTVLFVLDDDPTGSQAVHDVPILTGWDAASFDWALALGTPMVFVLTNSRSMDPSEVSVLMAEVVEAADAAAARAHRPYVVACRGDSTLRGHFPLETDVVSEVMARAGQPVDAVLLAPVYLEAGRATVDGVHYAKVEGRFVPVAETDYASDATFGYTSSRLPEYVEEKSGGRIHAADVTSVTLRDIREGGVARVTEILKTASGVIAVDALHPADLDILTLALLEAEAAGRRIVYRVGPSFVAARVGMEPKAPVRPEALAGHHGLVVVGSHVELTSLQVQQALDLPGVEAVVLDVPQLLASDDRPRLLQRLADQVVRTLVERDVVLLTSRQRVTVADPQESLAIARAVSDALVDVVKRVRSAATLGWVIAKGGITSHDVAVKGLGIRRAMVAGQLFEGQTSVWLTVRDATQVALADMPYVVFAGNVGGHDSLAHAVLLLRGDAGE